MKALKKIFLITLFLTFSNSYSQSILIFGGQNHDIFLGCLNCSKYDDNSIWNKYGDYSGKYSDTSPFNKYASYPPVLVDKDGNFYGYFTADSYKGKATDVKLALIIIENWEMISADVGEYYEKIFN